MEVGGGCIVFVSMNENAVTDFKQWSSYKRAVQIWSASTRKRLWIEWWFVWWYFFILSTSLILSTQHDKIIFREAEGSPYLCHFVFVSDVLFPSFISSSYVFIYFLSFLYVKQLSLWSIPYLLNCQVFLFFLLFQILIDKLLVNWRLFYLVAIWCPLGFSF